MSSIDLSNPGVLRNYIRTQVRELNGKIVEKEKVLVFIDKTGSEFIVPNEMIEEVKIKNEKKKAAKKEEPKKEEPKKSNK